MNHTKAKVHPEVTKKLKMMRYIGNTPKMPGIGKIRGRKGLKKLKPMISSLREPLPAFIALTPL